MSGEFFVSRPRFAWVISIVLLLAGGIAALRLPVAEYPVISPPVVMVSASYPGASSQTIADAVAAPLEAAINGVENMIYFSSSSDNAGNYTLTATFKPGTDEDMALVNVNNAVRLAEHLLPNEVVADGIKVSKQSSDLLCYVIVYSKNPALSLLDVSNYADMHIKDELARLDGVASVVIYGEKKYAMRVWLDPEKMRSLGISVAEVRAAIEAQNVQAAAGAIGMEGASDTFQFKIDAHGRLATHEEFAEIVVRSTDRGMRHVRLGDIARVELSAQAFNCNPTLDGGSAVSVAIFKLREANAIDLKKRVDTKFDELRPSFPDGLVTKYLRDQTRFVKASMREIATTLALTLLLVVLITWLFLRTASATLIPAIMIPVSLVGTCLFLALAGMSMNTLTMFAAVLVIGSVVDNAICVTEGCAKLVEDGLDAKEAARRTMRGLSGALVAATLVVVAVYAPIACAGGMLGTLYLQFSVTMCIALALSLVTALSLAPALASQILKKPKPARGFFRFFDWIVRSAERKMEAVAGFLARHALLALLLLAGLAAGATFLFKATPPAFVPDEDKAILVIEVVLPPGAAMARTEAMLNEIAAYCAKQPEVAAVWTEPGYSVTAGAGENTGYLQLDLKDWSRRRGPEHSAAALRRRVDEHFRNRTEAQVVSYTMPAMDGFGEASGVTFELLATEGQTQRQLVAAASNLVSRIMATGLAESAFSGADADTPVLTFDLDRDKVEAMGVRTADVFDTLQSFLGSYYVNDFNKFNRTYQVIIQADKAARADFASLSALHVTGEDGAQIPLDALGEFRWTKGARQIERFNMYLSTFMTAQTAPGVSTGKLMLAVEDCVKELGKGWRVEWRDLSYHERHNSSSLPILFALATIMAYLFLVAQYESWTMPFAAVLPVVTGVAGGLLAMRLTGTPMDIYCQLGLLMLVALSTKSAILMAEYSLACVRRGVPAYRAALTGFRLRFRSVMMTALSFIIGVMPFLFADGAGAGARRSIGVVTFYGMLAATFAGILLVPALCTILSPRRRLPAAETAVSPLN